MYFGRKRALKIIAMLKKWPQKRRDVEFLRANVDVVPTLRSLVDFPDFALERRQGRFVDEALWDIDELLHALQAANYLGVLRRAAYTVARADSKLGDWFRERLC